VLFTKPELFARTRDFQGTAATAGTGSGFGLGFLTGTAAGTHGVAGAAENALEFFRAAMRATHLHVFLLLAHHQNLEALVTASALELVYRHLVS
jgi:hypothetical protein